MGVYDIDGNKIVYDKQYPSVETFSPFIYHHNISEDLGQWINHNTYHEMIVIAHISDLHNDPERYRRFLSFAADNNTYIDAVVETGDLMDTTADSSFAEMNAVETDVGIDVLKCVGNHERIWNNSSLTNAAIYNKWNLTTNTGKTWYYKDYSAYAIRIIVVNSYESDTYPDRKYYSSEQLNWLISTLKDARTKNYSVVIAMHPLDGGRTTKNNKGFFIRACQFEDPKIDDPQSAQTPLEDIINAFKNGLSIQATYSWDDNRGASVTINDSFSGEGKFVCYMHGHYHQDMIGYSPKHTDQLYLGIATGCLSSSTRPSIVWEETSDLPRVLGEESEDLFNLYCIDTKNKFVKVMRVGSHINDILEERRYAVFNY